MSVTMLMTCDEIAKDREKWKSMRLEGIGGSDAGVIIGVNKWKSKFTLWLQKTKQAVAEDISTKESVYWGTVLEDVIAKRFAEITGKKVRRCGMLRNNENPFMLADIDRLVEKENAILEIKTTSAYNKDEWGTDEEPLIPPSYYCQVFHYLCVGGYDKAYVACLIGGQKLVIREVEFDQEEADALIKAEKEFWDMVVSKQIPEVDGSDSCTDVIRKMFPGSTERTEALELDGSFENILNDLEVLEADKKKLDELIKGKKNKLRLELGNNAWATTPTWNVSYKNYENEGIDKEGQQKLKKAFPEIYKQFAATTYTRKLFIKKSKARTKK